MVFFTCSHCGESVKKPSVAKHYQTKCRKNEPFLTCVDCLKDFKGNEYEAHTKCLTEDERYSAKGYVPKPSQNKGERKQQAWQECIQTVLKKPTLKPDERDLISAISKYENVPRKKAKFINFLSNAFKQYANRKNLIDRVWTEMESVFKEAAGTNEELTQQEENSHKEESQNNNEDPTPQLEENGLKKEKKKKRKTDETPENPEKTEEKIKNKKHKSKEETAPEADADAVTDETELKQEKKNKKRKKSEENGLPETNEQNEFVPEEAEPAKKKKKKKHSENEISETPVTESPMEEETKTKKKNKKSKMENAVNGLGAPEEGTVTKEKKEKKSENKENCGEKMDVEGGQEEEGKATAKKKKTKGETDGEKHETFDWKATILSVLNGKNKIPLQKLQKKVIKRHCQILNCESSQKKEKKFMKKLKEMPQIEIENDFVLLKS